MKVCIPVKDDKGLESVAYNHFGSAPFFLIYNCDTEEVKTINNGDLHHEHGMCQPLKALNGETIDAVLVGGIGAGALTKLNSKGIKVYKVIEGTAKENIKFFKENKLSEFSLTNSCSGHDCHH